MNILRIVFLSTFALLVLCSCNKANRNRAATGQIHSEAGSTQNKTAQTAKDNMTITISSSAFPAGEMIPPQYTCDGANISPPLQWSGLPTGTKTIVLVVDDPDAPAKTWVHWVVYDLPPNTTHSSDSMRSTSSRHSVQAQRKMNY